jgi:excisionase family DNA binding protein
MLLLSSMQSSYRVTLEEINGLIGKMKSTQRNLLTTEEFAAALGLSSRTIRQWTWLRRIPFVRVGGAIRFQPETVDEIVTRGSVSVRGKSVHPVGVDNAE